MRAQYTSLKRKIVLIMAAAAIIPLVILAAINFFEFQAASLREAQAPFRSIVAKTKNSFELFLAERSSTVSLIASIYAYEDLANAKTLRRIFLAMQSEFAGFVDLALINADGKLVNYVGPFRKELEGVDYSEQEWFHKVRAKNRYISEVVFGFKHFPHLIVAVQHTTEQGESWIVRATLDTTQFEKLLTAINLEPGNDAFLVNRRGILQTDSAFFGKAQQNIPPGVLMPSSGASAFFGKALESIPAAMPAPSFDAIVVESNDGEGRRVLISFAYIADTNFVLMGVKTTGDFLSKWLLVRIDLLLVFAFSVLCIYFVAARAVGLLIERLRHCDEEREKAMLQMEHTQKLSSIGRLAAGIAHEVNNPLAIINERAGLLQDILDMENDFPKKDIFSQQISSITAAVQRCRDITHRMLGFARRMDVKIENLNVNDMVRETLTFLEKEAQLRKVSIVQELDENLPEIPCDRGQLQQVFLNVLTNALAAVQEGGITVIKSFCRDDGDTIAVSFTDNGCGMDERTKRHIFEPFFTTKKEDGTGLGMSIIYGIVKRHGGDIEVSSVPGKGTTVTIVLPRGQTTGELGHDGRK